MAKSRTHRVLVTVAFDKPCTKAQAAFMFRDNVHGTFYPQPLPNGDGPDSFTIRAVKSEPAPHWAVGAVKSELAKLKAEEAAKPR